MKITPTLEECKIIAAEGSYGVIPISTELYADMTTPIEVLRILKKVSGHVYLLESAEADKRWGRYSFLGYDPLLEITCYNGKTTIKSELTSQTDSGDVRGIIRNVMEENKSPKLPVPEVLWDIFPMTISNTANRPCDWMRRTRKASRM